MGVPYSPREDRATCIFEPHRILLRVPPVPPNYGGDRLGWPPPLSYAAQEAHLRAGEGYDLRDHDGGAGLVVYRTACIPVGVGSGRTSLVSAWPVLGRSQCRHHHYNVNTPARFQGRLPTTSWSAWPKLSYQHWVPPHTRIQIDILNSSEI